MHDYQHRTINEPAEDTPLAGQSFQDKPTVRACVAERVASYLKTLEGQEGPGRLYRMMVEEVELPMLREVLAYTKDNCCQAARILGLNRGTLLARLERYGLDQEIRARRRRKLRGSDGLVSLQRFHREVREDRYDETGDEHRL